jgi:hypothetical protein
MNIYQILETLKRVEEGQMKHHMWDMAERMSLEKFLDMFPDSEDFYLGVHGVDSREELDQDDSTAPAQPGSWTPERIAAAKSKGDWVNETDDDDYESDEGDYQDIPGTHATTQQSAPLPDHVQQQIIRNPAMRADIIAAYKRQQGMAEGSKFKFANAKQRPGDQVRGTEKAVSKKGQHPFAGRLVGTDEAKATSQRLDPKCWSGKKIGNPKTKVKGGVRVNNCVPVEEEWEDFVNEYGMTTGGTATGAAQKNPADQAKKTADTQADVQKLKAAGVPIPSGSQAVQSLMKEPGKDPASALDKQISAGLGQEIQDIVTKGDSSDVNQLAALIRKVNQRSGA